MAILNRKLTGIFEYFTLNEVFQRINVIITCDFSGYPHVFLVKEFIGAKADTLRHERKCENQDGSRQTRYTYNSGCWLVETRFQRLNPCFLCQGIYLMNESALTPMNSLPKKTWEYLLKSAF